MGIRHQAPVTMPIRGYIVVVGAALLVLIFAADFAWAPQTRPGSTLAAGRNPALSIKLTSSVNSRDLRPAFLAEQPVKAPEPVTTGVGTREDPSAVASSNEMPKPTSRKTAEVKKHEAKKKKTNVATTRPNRERYARGYPNDYWRSSYYGGYGGWY